MFDESGRAKGGGRDLSGKYFVAGDERPSVVKQHKSDEFFARSAVKINEIFSDPLYRIEMKVLFAVATEPIISIREYFSQGKAKK